MSTKVESPLSAQSLASLERHPLVRRAKRLGYDVTIEARVTESQLTDSYSYVMESAEVNVKHERGGNGLSDESMTLFYSRKPGAKWRFHSMADFGYFRSTRKIKTVISASTWLSVCAPRDRKESV